MKRCADCQSTNIINTTEFLVYFREGDWIKRTVIVYGNVNSSEKPYIAMCPEKSKTATAQGNTEEEAIWNLLEILHKMNLGYGIPIEKKKEVC